MIKKLDKLIIKAFLGPFVAAFGITFFILMLQNLWKYIDDLVGKGLDFATLGKFIWYISASMLTLAMPIAILISSIMCFGNLGESFELVAIKSSGISLLRFMRPLIWVTLLLCGVTFFFANNVIPFATFKFTKLYYDIRNTKPAFDLKEGVFYNQLPGIAIKVNKKDRDGKTIHGVVIYEQSNSLQDNCTVADKGIMTISADKKYLEFTLYNGFRYVEQGSIADTATEFIRLGFKEYKKTIDLSSLKQEAPEAYFAGQFKMLPVRRLSVTIDSMKRVNDSVTIKLSNEINAYFQFKNFSDSAWRSVKAVQAAPSKKFDVIIPDSARIVVFEKSLEVLNNIKSSLTVTGGDIKTRADDLRFRNMEWHRKFSFSLACMVLFFIGAPLGSIIRKGGIGMPLVVAIVFFLIFHLLNLFGEKFAKENITSAFTGMWLAIMVLTPVGVFLTYKAMHDSQVFNKDFYKRIVLKIRPAFRSVTSLFEKKRIS